MYMNMHMCLGTLVHMFLYAHVQEYVHMHTIVGFHVNIRWVHTQVHTCTIHVHACTCVCMHVIMLHVMLVWDRTERHTYVALGVSC